MLYQFHKFTEEKRYKDKAFKIMINVIWMVMIISGIILAGIRGQPEIITQSAFEAAQAAVKYSIELIGIMSLWLGLMKVAEEAGMIKALAKLLRPFTRLIFLHFRKIIRS